MVVGVLRVDLVLHAPLSLKEKRGVVKKLVARLRNRYPVSCAETGSHDLWQRAELTVAMVAMAEAEIQRVFTHIEEELQRDGLAELAERDSEILHYS